MQGAAVISRPPAERVLVRQVNWLGDVAMSLPALRAVRAAYADASLAVLVRKELAGFFDGAGWIDEVLPYTLTRGWRGIADQRRVVAQLRARRFDLAIVLPRSFRSALWVALAGVPHRAGFVADGRRALLNHRAVRPAQLLAGHQVHDYLYMLHCALGIEGDAADFVPEVDGAHRAAMQAWLAARRRGSGRLIALAVAAAYGPAKEWPAAHYAALIDRLAECYDAESVLVGAPGERAKCQEIASAARDGAIVAAGDTTVGEALALLSLCDGFAGNDSGSMHVAAALGIPTVGIYGSTRPQRTGPLGPRTKTLHYKIECSPCMERKCRYGHYDCLKRIEVDEVAGALRELGAVG